MEQAASRVRVEAVRAGAFHEDDARQRPWRLFEGRRVGSQRLRQVNVVVVPNHVGLDVGRGEGRRGIALLAQGSEPFGRATQVPHLGLVVRLADVLSGVVEDDQLAAVGRVVLHQERLDRLRQELRPGIRAADAGQFRQHDRLSFYRGRPIRPGRVDSRKYTIYLAIMSISISRHFPVAVVGNRRPGSRESPRNPTVAGFRHGYSMLRRYVYGVSYKV